jgi:Tetracyclin repressor-like, C-terminal domain
LGRGGRVEPESLQEYRDRYLGNRRAYTAELIVWAEASGEFKKKVNPELLIDMIYGPIYYRLLVGHQKLDQDFGEELVIHMMQYLKT